MVRKLKESKNDFTDYCKYIADEIDSVYFNNDPQYDSYDLAIDIIEKYISNNDYRIMDDAFFTIESILEVLLKQTPETVSKIEDELAAAKFGFIKYADRDAYNEYEKHLLDYDW